MFLFRVNSVPLRGVGECRARTGEPSFCRDNQDIPHEETKLEYNKNGHGRAHRVH